MLRALFGILIQNCVERFRIRALICYQISSQHSCESLGINIISKYRLFLLFIHCWRTFVTVRLKTLHLKVDVKVTLASECARAPIKLKESLAPEPSSIHIALWHSVVYRPLTSSDVLIDINIIHALKCL